MSASAGLKKAADQHVDESREAPLVALAASTTLSSRYRNGAMARKARKTQDASSEDDDAPEVVSHSASKAYAKRSQKALQNFEAEEKARKKARNREKDRKLKERARATKGGKTGEKMRGIGFGVDQALASDGEDDGENGDEGDDVVARMMRAMREAEDEVESDGNEEDDEFRGLGREMGLDDDMASGSESPLVQDEDEDDEMSSGEDRSIDPEVPTDEEEMDDEGTTSLQIYATHKPSRKADYLADDLFAAAFASQNTESVPEKSPESIQQQTAKKRRRKFSAHPKDLVIGGRTIRTLPRRSQATARSVPSARARRFVDQSLAMKGKQALAKAKKKGWERRPANIGVMKYQGAPHGFARSTR